MTTESASALETTLHEHVTRGELAGLGALVWRPRQSIRTIAIRRRDVDRDLPVTRDTIFRIASATKPITTVAALTLLDEARFGLDDPITPGAPEWIAKLATLPLVDQPGAAFHYSISTDLLGFLLARIEGSTLEAVLGQRVLEPLGMHDTHFAVPHDKRHRRAALTGFDGAGHLTTLAVAPGGHALPERPDSMTFESAGQGLWTTADDYLAFARLFVGRGAVDGVRILRSDTCALMMSNQLTPRQRTDARMLGQAPFVKGHGYGMGVAVVMEPDHADVLRYRGGVGTIGWPGAYGTWWQADPNDGSVLTYLSHNMVALSQLAEGIGLATWSAIATFHALA